MFFWLCLTLIVFLLSSSSSVVVPPVPVESPAGFASPPPATPVPLPSIKLLDNNYHIFQTFNNCGPAALSMALSYYDINLSQQELGNILRPYQIAGGDNDDKSVTLTELADLAKDYGLATYHRPNGNLDLIKQFIAQGIPVITRTLLHETDDIGHYRIIKGYDDSTQEFIQDDSLQGSNLRYSYSAFDRLWFPFNHEYLVLLPQTKEPFAASILGDDLDPKLAWQKTAAILRTELSQDPNNVTARFNLSVALYHLGELDQSVAEFEAIEKQLPFRTLWYQLEPLHAYFELGNYPKVFSISEDIFNRQNRAYSEVYFLRGKAYQNQGNIEAAKKEFELAVYYHQNYQPALDALDSINAIN